MILLKRRILTIASPGAAQVFPPVTVATPDLAGACPVGWQGRLAHGRKAFTVVKLKTENMSALPERMMRSLKGKQIPRLVVFP